MTATCIRQEDLFDADSEIYTHIIPYEDAMPHSHDFLEFFYVFEGSGVQYLNGRKLKITAGNAFLLLPQDTHYFIALPDCIFLHRDILFKIDHFKKMCANLSDSLFDDISRGKYDLQFTLTNIQMTEVENFIAHLLTESGESRRLITNCIYSYLINLIIEKNLSKSSVYPTWLTRFLSMLSAPENLSLDLKQITANLSYSQEYLCRSFKKHIGMTMTDYFNHQKMKHAFSLLQTTNYTVEQICETLNFSNISYFYKLFKKHYKTTPHSMKKAAENFSAAEKPASSSTNQPKD